MSVALGIIAAVGLVVGIAGTLSAAEAAEEAEKAKAKAIRERAELKRKQADEILRRVEINVLAMRREKNQLVGRQTSGFAKAGVDFSGSSITVINATEESFIRGTMVARREARYKANQLRQGADIDLTLASDSLAAGESMRKARLIQGLGRGLQSLSKVDFDSKSQNSDLGAGGSGDLISNNAGGGTGGE